MALNMNKNLKLYYSIGEVAKMFDINESTLRYWESEFPHLKPKTNSKNVRQYTEKDIEQIKVIYNLVKVRGFKLAAARKMLNENRKNVDKSADILEMMINLRDELKNLKILLDSIVLLFILKLHFFIFIKSTFTFQTKAISHSTFTP